MSHHRWPESVKHQGREVRGRQPLLSLNLFCENNGIFTITDENKEVNMRLEAMYEGKRIVITDKSDSRNVDMLNQVAKDSRIELEFKPIR